MTNIAIDPDVDLKIDELARLSKTPKREVIREMLERGIEDFEDLIEAHKISQNIKNGQEEVFSTAQVRKALGLEN